MKFRGLAACAALAGACAIGGGAVADEGDQTFVMPRDVVSAATAFQSYMKTAAQVDGGFANGDAVAKGLHAVSAYEPAQLEEGMIAYGAVVALQDDTFVAGVQRDAGRGEARQAFAERLIEDPFAATRIDGAALAGRRIEAALSTAAAPLVSAGTQMKASAYSIQHQAWSKVMVANAQGRLAQVKTWSASRAQPSENDNQAMMSEAAQLDPRALLEDTPGGYNAIEARSLALAAEAVLGEARGADRDRLSPLLSEVSTAQCFHMAKLNLYQCMAVAGPQYEDVFCMGQHAMYDTGQCVSEAAHGVGQTRVAAYSPRPQPGGGAFQSLAAHHTLRIDPN
jgi:hypothetical protein